MEQQGNRDSAAAAAAAPRPRSGPPPPRRGGGTLPPPGAAAARGPPPATSGRLRARGPPQRGPQRGPPRGAGSHGPRTPPVRRAPSVTRGGGQRMGPTRPPRRNAGRGPPPGRNSNINNNMNVNMNGNPIPGRGGQGRRAMPRGGRCSSRGRGRNPARTRGGRGRGRIQAVIPPPPPLKKKKSFPKAKMKLREGEEEKEFSFSTSTTTVTSQSMSTTIQESTVKRSVRVLICSANLGNAQPDDFSIDEWIPSDGDVQLVVQDPPIYPVVATFEEKMQTEMERAGDMKVRELKRVLQAKGVSTRKFLEKSEFTRAYVEAGGAADLEEQETPDDKSTEDTTPDNMEDQTNQLQDLNLQEDATAQPQSEDDDFEAFLAARAATDEQVDDNNDPPGGYLDDNGVSDAYEDYEAFLAAQDVVDNDISYLDDNGNDISNPDAEYEAFLAAQEDDSFFPTEANNDDDVWSSADFDVQNWPDFEPQPEEEEDAPLPQPEDQEEEQAPPPPPPKEHFDIIVIGMQEATFETEEVGNDDFLDDELSMSSSDEEEEPMVGSTARTWNPQDSFASAGCFDDLDEYTPAVKSDSSKSKNLTGKVFSASLKAGKATLKVGKKAGKATLKAGNATIKTAKAAKTLITEHDHTNKTTPTPQQAANPIMDGGMSEWNDTAVLHFLFDGQLPSYERALSYQLGEMRLMVYYLKSAVDVDVLSVKTQATGKHGLANKGGIVAEVAVNQSTRLAFMTAHLEAHEGEKKYAKRCSSFRSILNGTKSSVTPCRYDVSLASHFTFFMGDLNFRTKLPDFEAGSPEHIQACHDLVTERNWVTINKHDELSKALRQKECLVGFRTPYCNFDPTFKVARHDGYEYNIKRSPSYADRILFKTGDQLEPALKILVYEPIGTFTTSDHKPIRGAFDITLNEKLQLEPAVARGLSSPLSSEPSTEKLPKEILHIFVSSIECEINQTEYNKTRQTNDTKTDLPSPLVSFVSTPSEAVQTDDNKRGNLWKSFGLGNLKKITTKLNRQDDSRTSKWPGTKTLTSTFEPKWSDEEIHFQVRTHKDDGDPIDLSGALLHLSLFDGKGTKPKLVGSFSLNLARLIAISKEPQKTLTDPPLDASMEIPLAAGWSYSQAEMPSTALLEALHKAKCPTPVREISKSINRLQTPVPNEHIQNSRGESSSRRDSKTRLIREPSEVFRNLMSQAASDEYESSDGLDASEAHKSVDKKLNELKTVSLKLDEPLTESGKEVGRISCCIDAWWMEVKDPGKDTAVL